MHMVSKTHQRIFYDLRMPGLARVPPKDALGFGAPPAPLLRPAVQTGPFSTPAPADLSRDGRCAVRVDKESEIQAVWRVQRATGREKE